MLFEKLHAGTHQTIRHLHFLPIRPKPAQVCQVTAQRRQGYYFSNARASSGLDPLESAQKAKPENRKMLLRLNHQCHIGDSQGLLAYYWILQKYWRVLAQRKLRILAAPRMQLTEHYLLLIPTRPSLCQSWHDASIIVGIIGQGRDSAYELVI